MNSTEVLNKLFDQTDVSTRVISKRYSGFAAWAFASLVIPTQNTNSWTIYTAPKILSSEALILLEKIKLFKNLEENWDSYGADPITKEAIMAAETIVRTLDKMGIKPYFVAPGKDGDILVEYKRDPFFCEIWVEDEFNVNINVYKNSDLVKEGKYSDLLHFVQQNFRKQIEA